jgi:hypothetical protein
MKYMKMLGLAAVVAGAFMAFVGAGSASAAGVLCLKNATPCGSNKAPQNTEIKSSLKEGKAVLTAGFGKLECAASEVNGHTKTTAEGGSEGLAEGPLTTLSFTSCNGTVETLQTGSLTVSWTKEMNGNVTAKGFKVHTVFAGVPCTYGGTVAEGITFLGGAPAVVKAEEAPIPKEEGGILCGSPAHWTATYKVTTPTELYMAQE